MNKKIITIAEIVFALVFVVLLSVFMATINSKGNTANTQLIDTLEMTDGTSVNKYENTVVKGTDVQNVATNYKTVGGNYKLTVLVETAAGTTGKTTSFYGYEANGAGGTHNAYAASSTDPAYINPSGNFYASLIKNTNGVIVGIAFEQNGTADDHTTYTQGDLQ